MKRQREQVLDSDNDEQEIHPNKIQNTENYTCNSCQKSFNNEDTLERCIYCEKYYCENCDDGDDPDEFNYHSYDSDREYEEKSGGFMKKCSAACEQRFCDNCAGARCLECDVTFCYDCAGHDYIMNYYRKWKCSDCGEICCSDHCTDSHMYSAKVCEVCEQSVCGGCKLQCPCGKEYEQKQQLTKPMKKLLRKGCFSDLIITFN